MKVIFNCFLLLFLSIDSAYFDQQIKIQILYESLCPDSIRFINEQLYPAWKDVAQHVQIQFVPFGKSASLENEEFDCQHGPTECKGNRIQSCALSYLNNANDQVEYVNCFMKNYRNGGEEVGETCAKLVGLDYDYVVNCYNTNKGTSLQLQAEIETNKISPSFIPTIVYNDAFNQELQDNSLSDFKGVVLSLVKN